MSKDMEVQVLFPAPEQGRLAQRLEHFVYIEGVGGSNPPSSTVSEVESAEVAKVVTAGL